MPAADNDSLEALGRQASRLLRPEENLGQTTAVLVVVMLVA